MLVLVVLGAAPLGLPLSAFGQARAAKIPRVGVLVVAPGARRDSQIAALRAGLRELGYVEGKNISFEFRWGEGDFERLPELAADLVHLDIDLIVSGGTAATKAVKTATTTTPIVMIGAGDPVGSRLVASLARPGGNVTGTSNLSPPLMIKRLELLKESHPVVRRVAVLLNPANPAQQLSLDAMVPAAKSLRVEIEKFEARNLAEIQRAISAMAKRSFDAMVVGNDTMLIANFAAVAELVANSRILSSGSSEIAQSGGLIGYGSIDDVWRHSATYVDRILRGAKPADLPVEQPSKFAVVVNLKTAKALGIKVPQSVLLRADRVIE